MPLSDDPAKRSRQLANLPNLRGEHPSPPPSRLVHGLRSRQPARITTDPIVAEIEQALAADFPLRGADGEVLAVYRVAIELAAISLLQVRRGSAYLALHGDHDERGRLRFEVDGLGKATERAARHLAGLGMTPRAAAALGLDVSRAISTEAALAAHLADRYPEDKP